MIKVTRLNKEPVVINSDLIKYIESHPDTLITLINGDKILVKEKMDVVIQQFNLHADFGNIPRAELKQHICDELNIAQRTANKLIKDVVDLKILKVDGRSIVEGANYGQN